MKIPYIVKILRKHAKTVYKQQNYADDSLIFALKKLYTPEFNPLNILLDNLSQIDKYYYTKINALYKEVTK